MDALVEMLPLGQTKRQLSLEEDEKNTVDLLFSRGNVTKFGSLIKRKSRIRRLAGTHTQKGRFTDVHVQIYF